MDVELFIDVLDCERIRKGCWRLQLELSWRAGDQGLKVQHAYVEVNRPWPVGETMRFKLGDGMPELRLTGEPEEL